MVVQIVKWSDKKGIWRDKSLIYLNQIWYMASLTICYPPSTLRYTSSYQNLIQGNNLLHNVDY